MKSISKICLIGISVAAFSLTPVFAETNNTGSTSTASPTASVTTVKPTETKDIENLVQGAGKEYFACMARATSARDESIVGGVSAYASGLTSAYSVRRSAVSTAWNSSENKESVQKAINDAEKAFKNSLNATQKTWNEVQNGANKQFSTARTECMKLSSGTTNNNQNIQSLMERIKQLEAQIKELRAKATSGVNKMFIPPTATNTQ